MINLEDHDESKKCENCVYFCSPHTECRRHPPMVYFKSHDLGGHVSAHPQANANGWCGHIELTKKVQQDLWGIR